MIEKHNCFDIARYEGHTFVTRSGNRYSIQDGCLHGRESVEGARVLAITGGTDEEIDGFAYNGFLPQGYVEGNTERLCGYLESISKPVVPGLGLILAFDEESAKRFERHGMKTSLIDRIEKD